jgi:poly(A) polymerase
MIIKTNWLKKFSPLIQMIRDNGGEARFVGGCVRDTLLRRKVNDFDLAITFQPQVLMKIFKKNNIRFIPTGLKHGTVTALIGKTPIEITTLRNDTKCDGRHAEVIFTENWIEDAKRRDFTFNALYLDINGNIYDYFNGINDLIHGELNFIGNPDERIQEDYLRILRAFRFHANICKLPISENILISCSKFKDKLDELSGERIQSEMLKLLTYKNAMAELKTMQSYGIAQKIFNFEIDFLKFDDKKTQLINDSITKLGLIIRNIKENTNESLNWINKRWKLSKKKYITLNALINTDFNNDIKKYIVDSGKEITKSILLISYAENKIESNQLKDLIEFIDNWNIPKFPLLGRDIKKLGYEGQEIGKILKNLYHMWEESSYQLTKAELISSAVKK